MLARVERTAHTTGWRRHSTPPTRRVVPGQAGRAPHWGRIVAVRRLLPFFDWVFYTDADTLITNSSVSLESILTHALGSYASRRALRRASRRCFVI